MSCSQYFLTVIVTKMTKDGKGKPFSLRTYQGDFCEESITLSFFWSMTMLWKTRYSEPSLSCLWDVVQIQKTHCAHPHAPKSSSLSTIILGVACSGKGILTLPQYQYAWIDSDAFLGKNDHCRRCAVSLAGQLLSSSVHFFICISFTLSQTMDKGAADLGHQYQRTLIFQ